MGGRGSERDKLSEALGGLARRGCATSSSESRVLKEKVTSQAMNGRQALPRRQPERGGMKGTEEEGGPKGKEGQTCQAHSTDRHCVELGIIATEAVTQGSSHCSVCRRSYSAWASPGRAGKEPEAGELLPLRAQS